MDEEIQKEVETEAEPQDKFREEIKNKLQEIRVQAMTTGAQTMMQLVSDRIARFENEPGKHSCSDYKRLVKSIKKMCTIRDTKKDESDNPLLSVKTAEPLTRMINTGERDVSDEQKSEDSD